MILGTITGNAAVMIGTKVEGSDAIVSFITDDVSNQTLCLLLADAGGKNSLCCFIL